MESVKERLDWFKAVILPHESLLKARMRRLCPSGFDVDDLVAESLARAYVAKDIGRITAGRGYLFTIARNLLIDATRRDTIVSLNFVADLDILKTDDTLEASLTARDQLRKLQSIIDALPPQCRRVFLLRRVHEFSLSEIAEQMSLSVSTVEKHLAKAALLLAKGVTEREENCFERTTRITSEQGSDRRAGGRVRR